MVMDNYLNGVSSAASGGNSGVGDDGSSSQLDTDKVRHESINRGVWRVGTSRLDKRNVLYNMECKMFVVEVIRLIIVIMGSVK